MMIIHVYTYICIYTCVYIYIYICIHTHTHDTRKVSLQVEEVAEPSRLDGVLKDAERCCSF